MRELAVDGVPVTVACRVLKLSRQLYYRWLADPITDSEVVEAYRANALFHVHADDPEFGHRLLADETRDAGEAMVDRTAWRIPAVNGWWSSFGKKRGKNGRKPGPAVRDDLCTIKDVFSNRIVGYSIGSRMKSKLAVNALENALARRGDVAGCVIHSDRGSQLRSRKFVRALTHHRMVGSMGRVASGGDNAAMESFFSLLQKNVLNRRSWTTCEHLRMAIVTWIERT
ncbi:transposase InsO family protein [Arthrobacter sp. CAN_A214]